MTTIYNQLTTLCHNNDLNQFKELASLHPSLDFEEKSKLVFTCVQSGQIDFIKVMHTLQFPVFQSEFVHRSEPPHNILYIDYFWQHRPQFFIDDQKKPSNFLLYALCDCDFPAVEYFISKGYDLEKIGFSFIPKTIKLHCTNNPVKSLLSLGYTMAQIDDLFKDNMFEHNQKIISNSITKDQFSAKNISLLEYLLEHLQHPALFVELIKQSLSDSLLLEFEKFIMQYDLNKSLQKRSLISQSKI